MTARMFGKFRPRRRTLTRKLTIELWVVGLASAILLALALALNATAESASETMGAAGVEGGRHDAATNPELKDFMERAAFAAAVRPAAPTARDSNPPELAPSAPRSVPAFSRAAVAPRASDPKAHATRVASATLPPPRPVLAAPASTPPTDVAPWRLVRETGASAVANLVSVSNSLSSLAKKFSL